MDTEQEIVLISSFIGMAGVLLGVSLTSFVNWKLKTKEARLRILEKVYEKRLQAYEDILNISRLLRTTISTKTIDGDGNVITFSGLVSSREMFDQFQGRFYELVNFNTHWLDIELFRELNFIQDYLGNVDILLKNTADENFPKVAIVLKQDFINLAADLEVEALKFFEKDIQKIKVKASREHHKYKKTETQKRLLNTELFKKWEELRKITG